MDSISRFRLTVAVLALVSLLGAACDRPPAPESSSEPTDAGNILQAKAGYERIVPLVSLSSWERFGNLIYEGNNPVMRGLRSGVTGLHDRSGSEIAALWRRYARGVRGLFVLRDSLYSQQDHPFANDPYAPLLPPNWVTAVVNAAATSGEFDLPLLPDARDDGAWGSFESEDRLFGDLPPSRALFEAAIGRRAGTSNARDTLRMLYRDVRAMIAAMPRGPEAVAGVGAERIAAGDRAYFGAALRRERIIPIVVENPSAHEISETKGLGIPGREVPPEILETVRRAIYSRRLEDGDLALERYDLSDPGERKRAISVLETLIPGAASTGTTTRVWLWVTGKLAPGKRLRGEDARPYVAGFRAELARADIDVARLELFSKPPVELPDDDFEGVLQRELTVFDGLDLSMSVALPATHARLRQAICCQD